ncbi:ankyrin repeat-containing protein [Carex littledalei]|uniref:Ankyrin repeat-containing protein n=1 Tax=Carex littledalei TaxID=544730 RepID=A0A833QVF0_9POAL|nr:ankyrin repeat-containing protein [Carex littledalei]
MSMQPGTSSSNHVHTSPFITEDTPGSSSSTNGSSMDKELLRAAISGNTAEIKDLISNNPEILFGTTSQGSTCLHISLTFGHKEFSEMVWTLNKSLLSKPNLYRETPLIVAVKSGYVSLASTLLKQYCQHPEVSQMILGQDSNGDSALHHAIRHGHKDLALELIEAEPNFPQKVNNYNESPMYIAVMRGFDDVFQKLLGTHLPNPAGAYDDNALHAAVRNRNLGIIKTIMQNLPDLAKAENKSGHSPIQYAVHRNQTDVIKVMLEQDHSLGYLVNKKQGNNPLLIAAASRGHIDDAREILKHCPDAPYHNEAGLTILHQAIIEDQEEFVEFIMGNRQLDKLINMRDSNGNTALHYAVQKCNPKIVRSLLAHKEIDVRIYDSNGSPAFWRLIETMDSAKSLNWNEVFMLMSRADHQATKFYLRQVAKNDIRVKSMQEIKSLTGTYTKTTSLVAILIATITFAAAFALPGGTDKGLPVMARKLAFKAFLISDTLAMCSSLAVAFICILTRWEDLKFLLYYRSFTNKLMWFALMATNVAFATGLYTVVAPRFLWLAILICILSISLPFLTYLLGKWPVLKLRYRLGSAFDSTLLNMV